MLVWLEAIPIKSLYLSVVGQRDIVGKFSWLFSLRMLQQSCSLITTYILVRYLDVSTYGEYNFFLTLLGIASVFIMPGYNTSVAHGAANSSVGIFRKASFTSFKVSVVGGLFLLVFAAYFWWDKQDNYIYLVFIAFLFPFSHGLSKWEYLLTGAEKYSVSFAIVGGRTLLVCAMATVGVMAFPGELWFPVLSIMLIPSFFNVFFTALYLPKKSEVLNQERSIAYGVKSSIYLAVNTVSNYLDKLLIYFLLGAHELAIYAVAEKVSELVKGRIQDFSALLGPKFSRVNVYTKILDRKILALSLLFFILIICFSIVFLPWLIVLLFSDSYEEAIPISQFMMFSVGVVAFASFRVKYVSSQLDVKGVKKLYLNASIFRVLFSLVLVPLFGLWGAAISAFLYRFLLVVYVHYIINKWHLVKE